MENSSSTGPTPPQADSPPFIGGDNLNHQRNERRERYVMIVDDFYFRDNNVG